MQLFISRLKKILIVEICILFVLIFIFMQTVYSMAVEQSKSVSKSAIQISELMKDNSNAVNEAIEKKLEEERKAKELEEQKKKEKEEEIARQMSASIPNGNVKDVFLQLVLEKGLSSAEASGWANIISHESNWRFNARNSSTGAYGLGQALPGSKMAGYGSDWETNPRTQLNWMYSYMIGRYGSISGAEQFFNSNGWY